MICRQCGEFNPAAATVCFSCGLPLDNSQSLPITQQDEAENTAQQESVRSNPAAKDYPKRNIPRKKSAGSALDQKNLSGNMLFGIFGGLCILGVSILFFSGLLTEPKEAEAPPQHTEQNAEAPEGPDLTMAGHIDSLEQLSTANPENLDLLLNLAHDMADSRFYDRAITKYQQYLSAKPNIPDVIIDMGVCYFGKEDYQNAEAQMRRALALKADHPVALFNLGIINLRLKNADEAKKWFNKVIELHPESEQAQSAKEILASH